jgi:hypothetical protein
MGNELFQSKNKGIWTFLAALGCLSVSIWFFSFVLSSGILENPKPNQTPMDSAKPAFLWIQALLALFSGIFLLAIAKTTK